MSEIKKLWHFRQNNSGGFYTGPAYNIIVEADEPEAEAWVPKLKGSVRLMRAVVLAVATAGMMLKKLKAEIM